LQIVAVSYSRVRTEDAAGQVTRQSGFGDLTVRTKINCVGKRPRSDGLCRDAVCEVSDERRRAGQ
jgi:hypothetical protein